MGSITLRKYNNNDNAALVTFWETQFPDDPAHNSPVVVIPAKLKVDDLIFICQSAGQIVGACMAGYDGHRGWLYAVAVDQTMRRRGIGERLVAYATAELKKRGCKKLNLQIRADNYSVEAFYKDLGFNVEERLSMGKHV